MCRAKSAGGRRCGCAAGGKRRSSDRARYAKNKATALNISGGGNGSGGVGGGESGDMAGGLSDDLNALSGGGDGWQGFEEETEALRNKAVALLGTVTAYQDFHKTRGEIGAFREKLWEEQQLGTGDAAKLAEEEFGIDLSPDFDVNTRLEEITAMMGQVGGMVHDEAIRRVAVIDQKSKEEIEAMGTELVEVVAEMRSCEDETEKAELGEQFMVLSDDICESEGYKTLDWQGEYADAVQNVVAGFRGMGSNTLGLHARSKRDVKKIVEGVSHFFPEDWWDSSSQAEMPLFVETTKMEGKGKKRKLASAHYVSGAYRNKPVVKGANKRIATPPIVETQIVDYTMNIEAKVLELQHNVGSKKKVHDPVSRRDTQRECVSIVWDPEISSIVSIYEGGSTTVTFAKNDDRPLDENTIMMPFAEYRQFVYATYTPNAEWETQKSSSAGYATLQHRTTKETRHVASEQKIVTKVGQEPVGVVTTDKTDAVTIHELAHRMEHTHPTIKDLENTYWKQRCTNHETGELYEEVKYTEFASGAKTHETVYPEAGFASVYTSKRYEEGSTELLSTGMDAVFGQRQGSLVGLKGSDKDDSHRNWTIGMLLVA